jgi:hypothetical protein
MSVYSTDSGLQRRAALGNHERIGRWNSGQPPELVDPHTSIRSPTLSEAQHNGRDDSRQSGWHNNTATPYLHPNRTQSTPAVNARTRFRDTFWSFFRRRPRPADAPEIRVQSPSSLSPSSHRTSSSLPHRRNNSALPAAGTSGRDHYLQVPTAGRAASDLSTQYFTRDPNSQPVYYRPVTPADATRNNLAPNRGNSIQYERPAVVFEDQTQTYKHYREVPPNAHTAYQPTIVRPGVDMIFTPNAGPGRTLDSRMTLAQMQAIQAASREEPIAPLPRPRSTSQPPTRRPRRSNRHQGGVVE